MRHSVLPVALLAACALIPALAQETHTTHHQPHTSTTLKQPGQAAFGALSEVVSILQADPTTDWSKVDVTRLRDHLVDMDEVVMRAAAEVQERSDELRITYTGTGRTLEAIRRMIPAHAKMMNGYRNWKSETEMREDGVAWVISASSAEERTSIRGLGPFGLLTLGAHHGPHHLAMARGAH